MQPAVVLLSGGLDSATVAAIARQRDFDVHALSFAYGQRHAIELDAARRLVLALNITHHVIQHIDLRMFGGSALTTDLEVPKDRRDIEDNLEIPATYVPARNTIFLSFALAYAEVIEAADIFIGVNALDYSGYPDCRPEYILKFQELARLATRAGQQGQRITIHAPLIEMTKAQIIETGVRLGVDYGLTRSCYDPDEAGQACGRCDSCVLRRRGFLQAGIPDPAPYSLIASGD